MAETKKEEIRQNRERIRSNLKRLSFTSKTVLQAGKLANVQQLQSSQSMNQKYKRRVSLEVKVGEPISILNDVYIQDTFEELFMKVKKINEGSQSVVYECVEKNTGASYAVKVIRKKDVETFKTLKEQYRVLKNLNHENIIKAHYLFVNYKMGTSHMVCQLCRYDDLKTYLSKHRKLKEAKTAEIITTILKALIYLHKKGVCHRDIKPENILYDQASSDLKLIDFQIAKMVQYDHQKLDMWTKTGTLHYMAPEMWKGGYNESVDIWALGVICYQMVVGRMPFEHVYHGGTVKQILQQEPKYDFLDITPYCLDFIRSCLQKNPSQRMKAEEAQKHPFLLRYATKSSVNSSPTLKKNSSEIWKKGSGINLISCSRDDDSIQLLNNEFLTADAGIRLIVDF